MAVNSSTRFAPPLHRTLPYRSPLAFFSQALSRPGFFTETPSPRLVSVRSQKPGPDGFGSRKSVSLEESEAWIGSSGSHSSSSSAIDFLTLCHSLKVWGKNGYFLSFWLPRKPKKERKLVLAFDCMLLMCPNDGEFHCNCYVNSFFFSFFGLYKVYQLGNGA